MELEFVYDVACPFAYLASTQVASLAAEAGVPLRWRPVLLGGLYRHVGASQVPSMPPPRARHHVADLMRQAAALGAELRYPPPGYPQRTVDAMRLLVAAPPDKIAALTHALFRALHVDGARLDHPETLDAIARAHGVAPASRHTPEARDGLFAATAWAAERGMFGVPAMVVGDDWFWGADRLHLVRDALGLPRAPGPVGVGGRELVVYHDFSSPFSYLASTQLPRLAAAHGGKLTWRPILVGALFKDVGTPNVPMLAMSEAKRRYTAKDLRDHARYWGVPFRFATTFPLRTVTALRIALLAPEATPAIYRAAWAEDRDIGDPAVLGAVLDAAGLDGHALIARTSEAEVKAALRTNTEEAKARGAFGVPTMVLDDDLAWGQDRLDVVARWLASPRG